MNANRTLALRRQILAAIAELSISTPTGASHPICARILPLDAQNQRCVSYPIELKNFDERGITFHHELPLSVRRAMVVLESPRQGRFAAEVDLTWCRFNQPGRYTSGGRFVQLVGKTA